MKVSEIKQKYPKSINLLQEYLNNQLKSSYTGPKELLESFPIEHIVNSLFSSPATMRNLYDFFDSNEIYLNITGDITWAYGIRYNNGVPGNSGFKSRIECEFEGYIEAFKLLEAKL